MAKKPQNTEGDVIFVTSFFSKKANRRIYAHEYGKRAFPIRVTSTSKKSSPK